MKFKTLSNKEVNVPILPTRFPIRTREACKSFGQFALGRLLLELYGNSEIILEEFSIPDSRLSLDFFLLNRKIAFEFQGKQHQTFSKFFHGTKKGLDKQLQRDATKKEWCDLNGIQLVYVYDDTISLDELKVLIYGE